METEDIVQRIAISGQDDIIAALGEIGTAGEEAFKRLGAALGVGGEIFAGLIAGITGVGAALGILAESGAASAHALENLSVQSGASVEDISAMGGALASVGAETEGLSFAFRRMGLAITSTWDQIQKDVRDRADLIIGDSLKIKETALSFQQAQFESEHFGQKQAGAELASENAKLNVWSAQLALRKELARQGKGDFPSQAEENQLKLAAAFEQVKQAKQAQIEADLRLEQLARQREEAELKVAQAALAAREAQKKAIEDQRNDINTLVTEVGKVADGLKTLEEARGAANLNIENIMKGIIGSTGPAAEAIQHFDGNLVQLATSSPKVLDVMKRTADFLKNSGDAAANAAVGMREFGRGSGTLVIALQRLGSEGFETLIQHFKDLGFETSKNDINISEKFNTTLETMRFELTALKDQISTAFQPVIGEGLEKFQSFIEKNRKAIVDFAATVANQARPVILDFFSIISGEKATQTTWVQPLVDGLKKVVTVALDAGKAIGAIFIGVTGGNLGKLSPDNDWLQKWVEFGEGIRKAISFVVDAFKLLIKAADDVGKAFSNITGIKFSGGEIIAGVVAVTAVFVTLRGAIRLAAAALEAFLVLSGGKALLSLLGRGAAGGAAGAAAGAAAAGAAGAAGGAAGAFGKDSAARRLAIVATRLGPAFARFVSATSLPLAAAIEVWTSFPELRSLSKENASAAPETAEGLAKGLHSDIHAPLTSSAESSEDYTPPGTPGIPLPRPRPKRRDRSKPVDDSVAPGEGERRVDVVRDNKTFHYNVRKEGFETPEEIEQRGTSLPPHKQTEDEMRIIRGNKATYEKIRTEKKSGTQTAAGDESEAAKLKREGWVQTTPEGGWTREVPKAEGETRPNPRYQESHGGLGAKPLTTYYEPGGPGALGGGPASDEKPTPKVGDHETAKGTAGDQIAAAADKQIAALNANTEALKLKATERPPLESVNKPTGDLTSQTGRAIPSAPEGPVQARGQNLIDDFVDRLIGKAPKDRSYVSEKPKAEPIQFPNIPTGFSTEQVNNFTKSVSDTVSKIGSAASEIVGKLLPNAPASQIQPATGAGKPPGVGTSPGEGGGPPPPASAPQTPATPSGGRVPLLAAPAVLEIASAVAGQLSLPFGSAAPVGQVAARSPAPLAPNAPAFASDVTRESETATSATNSSFVQSSATESILQRVFASVTEKASEFGSKLVESVRSAETVLNNLTQSAGISQKGAAGVPQAAEGNVTSASQVEKAAGQMFDAIVAKAESTMSQLRAILNQPSQIQTGAASGSQSSPEGHAGGGLVNPVAGVSTVQVSAGMASGGLIRSASSVQNMHITQGDPAVTFAAGGVITGAGGPKDDMVPIHASPGEYVVQAHAVQTYGVPFMHAINNETAPKSEKHAEGGMIDNSSHTQQTSSAHTETNKHTANYATGGIVGPITNIANRMADGGSVPPSLMQSSHNEIAIGRDGGSMGSVGRYAEGGDVQEKALPSGAQHFAGGVAHTVMGDSSVIQAIQNFTSGSVFGRMADTALPSESRLAFQQPARSEHPEKLGTVDMRTNFGDFQAQMNRNQVRDMSDKSTQAKLSRGGRRQSWYQG